MTSFDQSVYEACKRIPKGKVATYSDIAKAIGKPKACRAVGNALNKNRSKQVPCHRVIKSNRSLGGFAKGTKAKEKLLRKEGVEIIQGKVAERCLFRLV